MDAHGRHREDHHLCVYDGSNSYELALNTRDFTWRLRVVKSSER